MAEADTPAAAASSSSGSSSASSASSGSGGAVRKRLEELKFDNLALRALPVDKETKNYTRQVAGACFSLVEPEPVRNPRLVCFSPDVLKWIEVDEDETKRKDFAEYFAGNKLLPGMRPAAHCYCGHQFGHFSGQLGDGATMYLGEIITSKGERIELQFKGAGKTPYSRSADGRKVLRSSLREFLCSEAHHYLGIPTTRAGTIVTSDTRVVRDIFYDGNAIEERATVITRLAHSFIRFGSFEIAKGVDSITGRSGPSAGHTALIQQLLDYVVDTFYADVVAGLPSREDQYVAFFRELTRRTAALVARWQGVGWCHGVLNSDNCSILGITIDYGPFGFMEAFDPQYICNASDNEGRYRFEAQPEICGWNLLKLSQNLESFMPRAAMRACIDQYEDMYLEEYNRIMRDKLGLGMWDRNNPRTQTQGAGAGAGDAEAEERAKRHAAYEELASDFHSAMAETGSDFTNSFRLLSRLDPSDQASFERTLDGLVGQCSTVATRVASLAPRIPAQQMAVITHLLQTNPAMFRRPGMEEQLEMIQAEMERGRLREEAKKQSQQAKEEADRLVWRKWLEAYQSVLRSDLLLAQRAWPGRSAAQLYQERVLHQNSANPKYILRNWIAQTVIDAAEKGDYTLVAECLQRLRDPFDIYDRGEEAQQQQQQQQQQAAEAGTAAAASSSSSSSSVAALEAKATHDKPRAPSAERSERAHASLPPKGTQCAIHWNKERPEWASGLKVT